jgi:hypothetical protein
LWNIRVFRYLKMCEKFAAINIQATCNSREWFTNVDASWQGSVHDSRIWRNSVMLPILTTHRGQTSTERYFNQKHASSRVIIERCFGQLKRRFPVLMNPIRVSIIDRVLKIVISVLFCIIFQNFRIFRLKKISLKIKEGRNYLLKFNIK